MRRVFTVEPEYTRLSGFLFRKGGNFTTINTMYLPYKPKCNSVVYFVEFCLLVLQMHVPRSLYVEITQITVVQDRRIGFYPAYSYPFGKFHSNFMLSSSQLDNQPPNILSGILDHETAVYIKLNLVCNLSI